MDAHFLGANMNGPEDNPVDETQPTEEEYESWEKTSKEQLADDYQEGSFDNDPRMGIFSDRDTFYND
jgi:hypothetical protein